MKYNLTIKVTGTKAERPMRHEVVTAGGRGDTFKLALDDAIKNLNRFLSKIKTP